VIDSERNITIETEGESILITYIDEIKVDFVKMSYPILHPTLLIDDIRMLNLKDIAPMKLKAVTQRGSKKDFFDIFFLLKEMPLQTMLYLFKDKFKQYETFHVVKSLIYFEDAEQYPNPILFDEKISWRKVKETIIKAVEDLME